MNGHPQRRLPAAALAVLIASCALWPLERRLLADNPRIRSSAMTRLKKLPEEKRIAVIPAMIQALSSEDGRVCNRAAEALIAVGEPAVEPVIEVLGNADPYARVLAVAILGDVGGEPRIVMPELVAALDDDHPLVREEAAHALGRQGPRAMGAVPALFLTLKDPQPEVREAAATALKRLGVKGAEKVSPSKSTS